jgi:hypothetical protein
MLSIAAALAARLARSGADTPAMALRSNTMNASVSHVMVRTGLALTGSVRELSSELDQQL